MFPADFSDRVVRRYTSPGDTVLDPFAGRGTAVFSAAHQGRRGVGIEINPVGWVYAKTKLRPAARWRVERRLRELGEAAVDYDAEARQLPRFFKSCFALPVRSFLLAGRDQLDWKESGVDRTVAALLMVYLHGKRGQALSNQMRQTKSMAPDYAIRWWRERDLRPPWIDPVAFMVKRLDWRYAKGQPNHADSKVYFADCQAFLPYLDYLETGRRRAKLLFTSPPYFALTNYHYDQWLRLWLLGGEPSADRRPGSAALRAKFESTERYEKLIRAAFERAAVLLARQAVVYVRTGLDDVTYQATREALLDVFPRKRLTRQPRPYTRPTQTSLFGPTRFESSGEVDLILRPR